MSKKVMDFEVKSNKDVREAAFNSHAKCAMCGLDVARTAESSGKLGVMRSASNGIERAAICPECLARVRNNVGYGTCKNCRNSFAVGTYFGDEFTCESPNCPGCVAKAKADAEKEAKKAEKAAQDQAKKLATAQKACAKAGVGIAQPVVLPSDNGIAVPAGGMNPYVSKEALKTFVNSLIDLVYPEG